MMTARVARPLLVAAFTIALSVALPWATLAASQTVTIQDFSFAPQSVTVNVGDSVTWRNSGGEPHTATSNTPAFDTGVLNSGGSKTITFGTAGTFDYHCNIHGSMRGTVTVIAAVVTPAPTPPPTIAPTLPPTAAPTAPPTVAPTAAPTVAPATAAPTAGSTTAPTATAAPATSAPAATIASSPTPPPSPSPAPVAIAASPSQVAGAAPAPPSGGPDPLQLVLGVIVLGGIAAGAVFALRRR